MWPKKVDRTFLGTNHSEDYLYSAEAPLFTIDIKAASRNGLCCKSNKVNNSLELLTLLLNEDNPQHDSQRNRAVYCFTNKGGESNDEEYV
ncbi:hypothetical protein SporoP33_06825 [Sporosarcina sp. P33]|nr:hypothetical protein SporoP33_06825 [Sporosarcina sp. P33]